MEINTENSQQPSAVNPALNMDQNPENQTSTKKRFPIKTFLLILVLAVIAFGLTALALVYKPQTKIESVKQVNQEPPPQTIAQTILSISSNPVKLSTPSSFITNITINTGKNVVNKVQLELLYDPKVLTKVDITPGPFFTDPKILLKNIDAVNGRITFALGVQDGTEGLFGQGVLANLSFSLITKTASTSVTLLPKTQVSADEVSESVLKTTIDGLFNLNTNPISTKGAR